MFRPSHHTIKSFIFLRKAFSTRALQSNRNNSNVSSLHSALGRNAAPSTVLTGSRIRCFSTQVEQLCCLKLNHAVRSMSTQACKNQENVVCLHLPICDLVKTRDMQVVAGREDTEMNERPPSFFSSLSSRISMACLPLFATSSNEGSSTSLDFSKLSVQDVVIASTEEDNWWKMIEEFDFFKIGSGYFSDALIALHTHTGLSWALTICVGTLVLRLAFIPLQIYSERNTHKFVMKVTPQARKLYQQLTPKSIDGTPANFASWSHLLSTYSEFLKGSRKIWREQQCSPIKSWISPLTQLPIFLCNSIAIRKFCFGDMAEEFSQGGLLWFKDLTESGMIGFLKINIYAPEMLILPCASTAVMMLNLHLAFHKLPTLHMIAQIFALTMLPLTYQLPQACFVYWCTSFSFTTAHILVQRQEWYRKHVLKIDSMMMQERREAVRVKSVFDMSETKISDANLPDSNMAAVDVGISSLADMKERIALARELYKEDEEAFKREVAHVLSLRFKYEREVLLPQLLAEVDAGGEEEENDVEKANKLRATVENKVEEKRKQGEIVALPKLNITFEKEDGKMKMRIDFYLS